MAIMIPANETLEDFNQSMGEMHLSEMLKQLPDDYYIFHSARWNKRYQLENNPRRKRLEWHEADFLIYYPPRGIISVEVKDGNISYSRTKGWIQSNRYTGEMKPIDPMYQAQRSMFYFKEVLYEKLPNVVCPVCAAVWFTFADRESMEGEYPNNYQKETVLWANDMGSIQQVQHAIDSVFNYFDYNRREVDRDTVRSVLNVISPEFGAFESVKIARMAAQTMFHRMTREQSYLLDYLEEQQTAAIHGCAGTGKTVLAIQKAQRLADEDKVLFLCFNAFLKDFLQEQYTKPNLTITNLDSLYTQKTRKLLPSGMEGMAEKRRQLSDFLYEWQDYGLDYKHIIVDEGQDFANEHLEALHTIAMENDGCFYVFYDKHQFVQGEAMPTWIEDMECRLVLNRNCRNTREIALTSTRPVGIAEEKVKMKIDVAGSNSVMVKPRMYMLKSRNGLLEALDARISQYVQAGVPREQIVVLTMKTIENSLIESGDYRLSRKNVLSLERDDGKILFTTVRKFKGLEADAVICVDVDATTFETERNRNAFYVGASRAKLFLEILTIMPSDDDVADLANSISGGNVHDRKKALGVIAGGLKVKFETDIGKAL